MRRGLATNAARSKEEKAALIMRLRQREEETKKYGAPLGQVWTTSRSICLICHGSPAFRFCILTHRGLAGACDRCSWTTCSCRWRIRCGVLSCPMSFSLVCCCPGLLLSRCVSIIWSLQEIPNRTCTVCNFSVSSSHACEDSLSFCCAWSNVSSTAILGRKGHGDEKIKRVQSWEGTLPMHDCKACDACNVNHMALRA